MTLVIGCWMLAMAAGLCGPRWSVGAGSAATLLVWLATQPQALTSWAGWCQALVLGGSPWLLVAERRRSERVLTRWRREQAARLQQVSAVSRELLALQAANQEQEQQITHVADLYDVTKETNRTLHLGDLFEAFLRLAPRLLHARGVRFIDLSRTPPQVIRATAATDGSFLKSPAAALQPMEEAIVNRGGASIAVLSATAEELSPEAPDGSSRATWTRLWREQQPVAIVIAEDLPEDEESTLAIVANQLSLQCSRILLYGRVEALAVTDALTGLLVRTRFMERAREEVARSARHGLSCVLLMVDLDFFKQKNDTYGHLVGDMVLQQVARLLQRRLRDIDLLARFGGEEFILLLIETTVAQALPIAERIRQLVEATPLRAYDEVVQQTISIGVAAFPEHAATLDELIERADQALYAAKRAGRNRVIAWSVEGRSSDES